MNKQIFVIACTAAVLLLVFVVATKFYGSNKGGADVKAATPADVPFDSSLLVRGDSPTLGPLLARVTLVKFLDPECESCRRMHPITKRVLREYDGHVRLVIRYLPLHLNSKYAATVLEAAGEQRRYWEMLDVLFEYQPQWGDQQTPEPPLILDLAARIGLDLKTLQRSVQNPAHAKKIRRDEEDAKKLRVMGTPTFFVNGTRLQNLGYEPLKAAIEQELAR